MDNYFDSPQRKERLRKVQDHHLLYQGSPTNPGYTRVTSMTNMFHQCLLYYHGLKFFWDKIKSDLDQYDSPNIKHDDKLFVTIFDVILKEEWQAVQQMEAITFQLDSYANNGSQMNRVMASWIIFLRHETSKFISSTRFQFIPFEKRPRSTDSYKNSICRRVQVKIDELNYMTQKFLLCLNHQCRSIFWNKRLSIWLSCSSIFVVITLCIISLMPIYTMKRSHNLWMRCKESWRCWTTRLPQSKNCALNQRKKKIWKKFKMIRKEETSICIQGHK